MQSEELLEKTASERLTLEEEYEMQQTWAQDPDKLTFILLADFSLHDHTKTNPNWISENKRITGKIIGDVNIFLNDPEDPKSAEIEIMVAESRYRCKGYGKQAVLMMMNYAIKHLDIHRFTCKISESNEESIKLFKEKLSFKEISHSKVFQEYTLELCIEAEKEDLVSLKSELNSLEKQTKSFGFDELEIEYL